MRLTTRFPLERLAKIDQELRQRSWPNATSLAAALEVTPRTIHRDIDFMRVSLKAPIEYDFVARAGAVRGVLTKRRTVQGLADWSATQPQGHAYPHVFRKTGLQSAWIGDDEIDKRVAEDAGVGKKVLMTSYVKVLREKSNRTYRRVLEGLPAEVLRRFGHEEAETSLEEKLLSALATKDLTAMKHIVAALERDPILLLDAR